MAPSRNQPQRTKQTHPTAAGASVCKLPGLSVPNLGALPLHGDARGIADLDPDAARARQVGAVDLLRHDALGAEPTRVGEHGKAIFGNVFVKAAGEEKRTSGLPPRAKAAAVVGAAVSLLPGSFSAIGLGTARCRRGGPGFRRMQSRLPVEIDDFALAPGDIGRNEGLSGMGLFQGSVAVSGFSPGS
jgi:hypothetical protein